MKGFSRPVTQFSLCGLNCALCTMNIGGYCPGCGGGEGNQSCRIARCSLEHGNPCFCFECPLYPCPLFDSFDSCDSFIPHGVRTRDVERMRTIGLAGYLEELEEKRKLLLALIRDFDDGRRKTFFSVAVYLLDLGDLEEVMAEASDPAGLGGMDKKARAEHVSGLLRRRAAEKKLELRLRRAGCGDRNR